MYTASNIRVSVQWKQSTVFAGEGVECTITFKNIAPAASPERSPVRESTQNGYAPGGDRQRKTPQLHSARPSMSRNSSFASQAPTSVPKGHRSALSLNAPGLQPKTPQTPSNGGADGSATSRPKHGRSLSIMSIGSDVTAGSHNQGASGAMAKAARGHGRSASVQVMPLRPAGRPALGNRSTTQSSPLGFSSRQSTPETPNGFPQPTQSNRRPSIRARAPNTPSLPTSGNRRPSEPIDEAFKFPAAPAPQANRSPEPSPEGEKTTNPRVNLPHSGSHSPRLPEEPSGHAGTLSPISRILSGNSMNCTPRSSVDFYTMSNNSTETLASEYIPQPTNRLLPRLTHNRRTSTLAPSCQHLPETLMMGYAQIMGSFTLDGSLVNQAPFEEVKRKGVVGGHGGGGVVGVERTKRESGLFGNLGWSSIGESLGGLLSAGEPSSIREMRNMASSKTIPLISTPQSILFVDLRLAPGESRSYSYRFTLPRGLPPSHRGRAMKVSYNLTIGTQRPGSAKNQQQIKAVEVPFRVFGSVTSRGEILGHDLMSPYILLRDQARTASISDKTSQNQRGKSNSKAEAPAESLSDFLAYVNNLLDHPRQNSTQDLSSPTELGPRRASSVEEPQTMKEAIDLAILRSNVSATASANRFEIARSGRRVAVVTLTRPAYRLGETVTVVIDFSNADIPCYGVQLWLESAETVDPAIALRSAASVHRVTRKVHAAFVENALYARRLSFAPTIPPNATPEFVTSGMSLEWKLGIEFVTPRLTNEMGEEIGWDELLEEVASDDRGVTLAPVERLPCESFEVAVPIRVYGAVVSESEGADVEELVV